MTNIPIPTYSFVNSVPVTLGTYTDGSVTVPTGYKIVGGGVAIIPPENNVITKCQPESGVVINPTTWVAEVLNFSNCMVSTMYVYAIAIYDPNNSYEVDVFTSANGSPQSNPVISVSVGSGFVLTGGGAQSVPVNQSGVGNSLVYSYPLNSTTWTASSLAMSSSSNDLGTLTTFVLGIKANSSSLTFSNSIITSQTQENLTPNPLSMVTTTGQMTCGGALTLFYPGRGNFLASTYPSSQFGWRAYSHDQVGPCPAATMAYLVDITLTQS